MRDYVKAELRQELLRAYGGCCAACGRNDIALELDHIVPRAKGGLDIADNISLLCYKCNMRKWYFSVDDMEERITEQLVALTQSDLYKDLLVFQYMLTHTPQPLELTAEFRISLAKTIDSVANTLKDVIGADDVLAGYLGREACDAKA